MELKKKIFINEEEYTVELKMAKKEVEGELQKFLYCIIKSKVENITYCYSTITTKLFSFKARCVINAYGRLDDAQQPLKNIDKLKYFLRCDDSCCVIDDAQQPLKNIDKLKYFLRCDDSCIVNNNIDTDGLITVPEEMVKFLMSV